MTDQYNLEIAKMLGWKIVDGIIEYIPDDLPMTKEIGYSANGFLQFHKDWNWLMLAIKKLNTFHNDGNSYRDEMYTMQLLLSGGYLFNSDKKYDRLLFSIDNLFERVGLAATYYNIIGEKDLIKIKQNLK
jgi:hypothetical protein